ncbi:MAG: hypothetical protein ABSA16_05410 [Thermoguttaceae bacterium]
MNPTVLAADDPGAMPKIIIRSRQPIGVFDAAHGRHRGRKRRILAVGRVGVFDYTAKHFQPYKDCARN